MVLAAALRDHRGPVSADLRRYYRCNLPDVLAGEVAPMSDIAAWVANLPPDSALHRAIDPHWRRSNEVELMRMLEYGVRILAWQQSEDGRKGRKYPEPVSLPWDPPIERGMAGDSMGWDEAGDWLGWSDEMRRYFADD